MKNNNDIKQPPAEISPEEILALDKHIEELNKIEPPNRKLTAREILDLDYDKYMWKSLDCYDDYLNKEKIGITQKLSTPNLEKQGIEEIALSKVKYVEKVKNSQFSPGNRVNLTSYLRSIYSIPPDIFEFGAIIIDINNEYLPGGQISKVYRLQEFIPTHYPKPKHQDYLEFEVLEGNDDINNYLEVWNDNRQIKKKNISKILGCNSGGSIRGVSVNKYYYDEIKSFMPNYSDEEYVEMAKKVEIELEYKKRYCNKPPEKKRRGHPMTDMFKI